MRVRVPFAFLGGLRRQVEFPLPQFAEALNKYSGISFRKPTRMGMAPATIWSISPARIRSVATTPGGFPSARRVRECRFGFHKPPTVASRCNGRRTWPIPVRGRPWTFRGIALFFPEWIANSAWWTQTSTRWTRERLADFTAGEFLSRRNPKIVGPVLRPIVA